LNANRAAQLSVYSSTVFRRRIERFATLATRTTSKPFGGNYMRIAALCGMGFGTSLMLKMFVGDLLKELGLEAEIIPWDLGSYKGGGKVDLIIAPQDMESHLRDSDTKVVLLQNITNKTELREKVTEALRELGQLPS
jgi:PTS system ascorbate-specific IIB component